MHGAAVHALAPWPQRPAGDVHRSLWLREALADAGDDRGGDGVLTGTVKADVCIVGGGYTGLWTAIRLRELDPALDVCLVEADVCGAGASGRNGGFAHGWWPQLPTLTALVGATDAVTLARHSAEAVDEIGRFSEQHGIDCDFRRPGWTWMASNAAQVGAWDTALTTAEAAGVSALEPLDGAELAKRTGTARALAGVIDRGAATLHPARLARGLRRVALELGVRIHERSPVQRITSGGDVKVVTNTGTVCCERVVLALNAWMAHLDELRRFTIVVSSDVVATRRDPEHLERHIALDPGICAANSRMMIDYYRTTLDGRLVLGSGGGTLAYANRVGPAFDHAAGQLRRVAGNLRALLPEHAALPIEHGWSGPVDRTRYGALRVGSLGGDERILYAIGYSGNGVAATALGGRILASTALGRDDEWTMAGQALSRAPTGSFPPEPARYVGGRAVQAAVARKEAAEDRGRRPSAIAVAVSRAAPGGITHAAARRSGGSWMARSRQCIRQWRIGKRKASR